MDRLHHRVNRLDSRYDIDEHTVEMLKEAEALLTAWIDALLGGKYTQTTTVLRSTQGFCCLGVLCDIVEPSAWGTPTSSGNFWWHGKGSQEGGEMHFPPFELTQRLGLSDGAVSTLSAMNDSEGASFQEIAEVLDEHRKNIRERLERLQACNPPLPTRAEEPTNA